MARVFFIIVMVYLFKFSLAEPNFVPPFFYPVEHRSDLESTSDQEKVSLNDYDLQIVPNDQFPVTEYDPTSVSILDLAWDYIPSPITLLKKVCKKILTVAKFLIPLDFILLGMALVVGFCAFTPYCTLIIEKPLVHKFRSIRENIPYLDDVEIFFREAYSKLQAMQN